MTTGEMVTTFSTGENSAEPKPAKVADVLRALNAHLKERGLEAEEYDFSPGSWKYDDPGARIPRSARFLIAFAVEGGSEGYYVHVGAILTDPDRVEPDRPYLDFGFAKMNTAENAYAIATEAQRFLTAARWN